MGKLFNLDAPVVQFMGKVGQMIITTLMWILCCLPVITVGASTAAMYRIMFNLKEDGSCKASDFFRAFRDNFKQATLLWLILVACVAALAGLYWLVLLVANDILRMVALAVFILLFFLVFILGLYGFPLTAFFDNTLAQTLRNAIGMGVGNLRQTILAGALTLLPLVLAMVLPQLFLQMMFLLLMMGPGALAYGVVCVLLPVFQKYLPQEE